MLIPILDGHNDSLHHLYPYGAEQVRKFFVQHTEGRAAQAVLRELAARTAADVAGAT